MVDSIVYYRKSGVDKKGLFMTKSANDSKIYKVCKKADKKNEPKN